MEIVNQKFNNFKQFILEIDNTNDWVTWFVEKVDLPAFLLTIREKKYLSNDQIYNQLIETTELKQDKLTGHTDKLKKYIEYFSKISNVV